MSETDSMYYAYKNECVITEDILKFIEKQNSQWTDHWYWDCLWYPVEDALRDPFMLKLAKRVRYKIGILRGNPKRCYDWHIDLPRECTVNLLLTPHLDSKCAFSHERKIKTKIAIETNQFLEGHPFLDSFSFHELKYQPKTFYLFNTKIDHVVYNFSDSPRYLMSLEFQGEASKIKYNEMLEIIKDIEKED